MNTDIDSNIKLDSKLDNKFNVNQIVEFFKGLGTIFLYLILSIIGALLFSKYYYSNKFLIANFSQLGTYFIMLVGLCLAYSKKLLQDLKTFKKEYLKQALKNWVLGLSIMIISNIIITAIVGDIAANESLNRNLLFKYPLSNILYITLMGPLMEEITFRLSFKKAFKKWYTFALTTAFIFGLAHIASPELKELLFIIPYGALGFFFAKAFFKTDNIYTSFIMHALHNSLSLILILGIGG